MRTKKHTMRWVVLLALLVVVSVVAQTRRGGGRMRRDIEFIPPEHLKEQEAMEKALNPDFREDTFTFARLKFQFAERGGGFGGSRPWDDDAPNADLNLSFRLFETTSLAVRPGLTFIDITTKDLERYPLVYMAAAGRVIFTDEEVADLRHYLSCGGFLMADDFWGDEQWEHLHEQLGRIFPGQEPVELTLEHRIFHSVFDFKKQPQIPSVGAYYRTGQSFDPGWPYYIKNQEPHYYALYDDKKRMVALLCHNNHYGDGWEHEGDDVSYFEKFSEPMGYPMFINLLVYVMSH